MEENPACGGVQAFPATAAAKKCFLVYADSDRLAGPPVRSLSRFSKRAWHPFTSRRPAAAPGSTALPTPQPSASAASTPVRQPAPVVVPYQPAVAIKKVSPSFPPELQTVAVGRKVIEVTVTIDKNGKVTKAEAAPQKNVSQFLVNSAVTAARLWRFQPAVRGTEPISSEMVLRFVFNH